MYEPLWERQSKYSLTKETIIIRSRILHRIKAERSFGSVKEGDLGGFVESMGNLSQHGDCWIFDNAIVFGNARITENACIHDSVTVYDNAVIRGNAQIYGISTVNGFAHINCNARIYGSVLVAENVRVNDNVLLYGDIKIYGRSIIYGDTKIKNSIPYPIIMEDIFLGKKAFITKYEDFIVVGPLGSRHTSTTFYRSKDGNIFVSCGCFNDTIEKFEKAVHDKHYGTKYEKQYLTAIKFASELLKEEKQNGN